MRQIFLLSLLITFMSITAYAQVGFSSYNNNQYNVKPKTAEELGINPDSIDIVRDSLGVAHIFGKTDAEVAYGLAWATCEDDFETMQWGLLAAKGMVGRYLGVEGAAIDFAAGALRAREIVEQKFGTDVSPHFKRMLQAYMAAANEYARTHKKEVLVKKAFPASDKDLLTGYVLVQCLMSGVDGPIKNIIDGKVDDIYAPDYNASAAVYEEEFFSQITGSNAFAFAPSKTQDGQTYLAVNSHQPIEGPLSWYEVHLCSEEGWNITGGTFHGGTSVFHGTNEHLGWAHTTNDFDRIDIYQLEMHPKKKNFYKVDDEWLKLEKGHVALRVKIKGLPVIPVRKKTFWSIYGATFKNKKGVYSVRLPANQYIGAPEQWFWMNKTTNLEEFKEVLNMQQMSSMNVTYADKYGDIYYISNGIMPDRNPAFDYSKVIPGNTRASLWTDVLPMEELPQVENPECGWVFNANNNPFYSTGEPCNVSIEDMNQTMGFDERWTNRGFRVKELMENKYAGKISWQDFMNLKYDKTYPTDTILFLRNFPIIEVLDLDENQYPDIADAILKLKRWNTHRSMEIDEPDGGIVLMTYLNAYYKGGGETEKRARTDKEFRIEFLVQSVRDAKAHLIEHFGTIDVKLGDIQRIRRGDMDVPIAGGPDLLRAVYCHKPDKDGRARAFVGDAFLQMVRFTEDGPEINAANIFGTANKPGHPHSIDQMESFTKEKHRKMTLDKKTVYSQALEIYSPKDR